MHTGATAEETVTVRYSLAMGIAVPLTISYAAPDALGQMHATIPDTADEQPAGVAFPS